MVSLGQGIDYGEFTRRANPFMTDEEFREEFKDIIETKMMSEISGQSLDVAMQVLTSMISTPLDGPETEITDTMTIALPLNLGFEEPAYIVPSFQTDNTLMACMVFLPNTTTNMQASIVMKRFTEAISPHVKEMMSEQSIPMPMAFGIGDKWSVIMLQLLGETDQSSLCAIVPAELLSALSALTAAPEEPATIRDRSIRNSQWGDSRAVVERKEGKPDMFRRYGINNEFYAFEDSIAGYKCNTAFVFTFDDQLYRVHNLINVSDDLKIDVYKRLERMLTEKYGEPMSSTIEKSNDYIQEKPIYIELGYLSYSSWWFNDNSVIVELKLHGTDTGITLALNYIDYDLMEHEETQQYNDL